MTRIMWIDVGLVSEEIIMKHLVEIEYKYVACYTNINSVKTMINDLKRAIAKEEWENPTLEMWLEEQISVLKTNIKATKSHAKNINYLKKLLWT